MAKNNKFRQFIPDDDFDYEYLPKEVPDQDVSYPPTNLSKSPYNADDDCVDDFWL